MKPTSFLYPLILLVIVFLLIATALTTAQIVYNDGIRRQSIRLLNTFKCMHGQDSSHYYKYSKCAEDFAANHAKWMADNNKFQHSSNSYKQTGCNGATRGLGENLAAGHRTSWSAINAFYRKEIGNFNPAKPNDNSKGTVGHLTAMLWKDANIHGGMGAYNADSTYKYFWSNNMGSSGGGTAPNTSSKYVDQVPPVDRNANYTICEAQVFNYYNKNPLTYWTSGTTQIDGFTLISGVTVDNSYTPTLSRSSRHKVMWTASNSDHGFSVIFCDVGTSTTDVPTSKCATLATVNSGERSSSITIPSDAQLSNYGTICVETNDVASERACLANLKVAAASGDGGVTPGATYSWKTSEFGNCEDQYLNQRCGQQVKRRSVICVNDSNQVSVDKSNCEGDQPFTDSNEGCEPVGVCQNKGECKEGKCMCPIHTSGEWCEVSITPATYSWRVGAYTTCSDRWVNQKCGAQIKRRPVDCINDSTLQVVDKTNCNTPQPSTDSFDCRSKGACANSGKCDNGICACPSGFGGDLCQDKVIPTTYSWKTTDYGACVNRWPDQKCGQRIKHRKVACVNNNDTVVNTNLCDSKIRPDADLLCDDSVGTCQNSGKCDDSSGVCQCPTGYSGDLCSTKTSDSTQRYQWKVGKYGHCVKHAHRQTCGPKIKRRSITCIDTQRKNKRAKESLCHATNVSKPDAIFPCSDPKDSVGTCLNYGVCNTKSFRCNCANGFTGSLCDKVTRLKIVKQDYSAFSRLPPDVRDKAKHAPTADNSNVPTIGQCPDGYYTPIGQETTPNPCQCQEIYMKLNFTNPPHNLFKPNMNNQQFHTLTPEQFEYFDTMKQIFANITGLPEKQFYIYQYSTNKDATVVHVLVAIRDECDVSSPSSSNVFTERGSDSTIILPPIRPHPPIFNTPQINPHPPRQNRFFSPFQNRQGSSSATDDVAENPYLPLHNLSLLYGASKQIIATLTDPTSPFQEQIPTTPAKPDLAMNAPPQPRPPQTVIPINTTASNSAYDPSCIGDTCPPVTNVVGDIPQKGKKSLKWLWILIGCIAAAIFAVVVIFVALFAVKKAQESDTQRARPKVPPRPVVRHNSGRRVVDHRGVEMTVDDRHLDLA